MEQSFNGQACLEYLNCLQDRSGVASLTFAFVSAQMATPPVEMNQYFLMTFDENLEVHMPFASVSA